MLHQSCLEVRLVWDVPQCREPLLTALSNPHFTGSTASPQRTKQKMDECDIIGVVTRNGSDSYVYNNGKRTTSRKNLSDKSPWDCCVSRCITVDCSAFLLAVETAGSRRQDNSEHLLLCQAALSQRNVEIRCPSCSALPLAMSIEYHLEIKLR